MSSAFERERVLLDVMQLIDVIRCNSGEGREVEENYDVASESRRELLHGDIRV